MTKLSLEEYLEAANLQELLHELGAQNADLLVKEISHFTIKEAEKRDKIVLGYFGVDGVNKIIDSIITGLTLLLNSSQTPKS